jgi:hypothetical protein
MNLFMHYAFDCWMKRTYSHCPFARYADGTPVQMSNLRGASPLVPIVRSGI